MLTMLRTYAFDWLQPGTRKLRFVSTVVALLVLLIPMLFVHPTAARAFGAPTFNFDPLSSIQSTASGWWATSKGYAEHLFFLLIGIEVTVFGIQMALFRDNLGEFFGGTALKVITIGLFLYFIRYADSFFPAIFNSLDQAGGAMTAGHSEASDIGTIVVGTLGGLALIYTAVSGSHAADMTQTAIDGEIIEGNGPMMGEAMSTQGVHFWDDALVEILGFLIIMAIAVVILQYVIIQAEAAMVLAGGVIFLGFSGSKFTLPFAQGYMGYAVNVGAKLLALHLGLAVAANLSSTLALSMAGTALSIGLSDAIPFGLGSEVQVLAMGYVAFQTLIMASILWFIPNLAGSFISGQSTMSGSQMMSNMMSGAQSAIGAGAFLKASGAAGGKAGQLESNGVATASKGSLGGGQAVGGAGAGHGGAAAGQTGGGAVATSLSGSGGGAGGSEALSPLGATSFNSATSVGNAYKAGLSGGAHASSGAASGGASLQGGSASSSGGGGGAAIASGGGADSGAAIGGSGDGGSIGSSGGGVAAGVGGGSRAATAIGSSSPGGGGSARAGGLGGGASASGGASGSGAKIGSGGGGVSSGGGSPGGGGSVGGGGSGSGPRSMGGGGGGGETLPPPPGIGSTQPGSMDTGGGGGSADYSSMTPDDLKGMSAADAELTREHAANELQEEKIKQKQDLAYALGSIASGVPKDGAPAAAVSVRLGLPDKL